MALNVKALIAQRDHPQVEVVQPEDKTAPGAQQEQFEPKKGAKEKALDDWQQLQNRLRQLLDVL